MFEQKLSQYLLAAMFVIPLTDDKGWQVLQFRKIKPNKVEFSEKGLGVSVNKSASPIIFPLPKPMAIHSLSVKGSLSGLPKIPKKLKQGEKGADDFAMKIGLVIKGEKKLNFFQRQISPEWVLTLFKLAPKGMGVNHIHFLNLINKKEDLGQSRKHPLSDLIFEDNEWILEPTSEATSSAHRFDLNKTFKKPMQTLAIWLGADGDDTESKFNLELKELVLNTVK